MIGGHKIISFFETSSHMRVTRSFLLCYLVDIYIRFDIGIYFLFMFDEFLCSFSTFRRMMFDSPLHAKHNRSFFILKVEDR